MCWTSLFKRMSRYAFQRKVDHSSYWSWVREKALTIPPTFNRISSSNSRLGRQVTQGKTGLIWVPLRREGAKTGPTSAAAAPDARWTKDISGARSELNMSPRDGVGGGGYLIRTNRFSGREWCSSQPGLHTLSRTGHWFIRSNLHSIQHSSARGLLLVETIRSEWPKPVVNKAKI